MIDRQEARSDVARIDPAADRWLHTANRARASYRRLSFTLSESFDITKFGPDRCEFIKKLSFEPDLNQRPMDDYFGASTVHRSTN
jgi:hypothetical protein